MHMKSTHWLLWLLVAFMLIGCTRLRFVVDAMPADDDLTETVVLDDGTSRWGGNKIAMLELKGLIADARRPGLIAPGENPVADFVEGLKRAENDHRVRAVLVRLNSPGGTVTGSDIIYREINRFKDRTDKPVIMLMSDIAASGAYYIACAGDEIIAHPTTVTGSIGVIIQTFNFAEGMRRIGIHADAIVSGDKKAAGSPFEPMPAEHRALLQGLVDEFYESFLTTVTTNRTGLSDAQINEITDGRVVTGRHAHELGLVDRIGDLYDAFEVAKEHADLERARLVKYHRPVQHVGSPYSHAPAPVSGTQLNLLQLNLDGGLLNDQPSFYYLWDPSAFSQ